MEKKKVLSTALTSALIIFTLSIIIPARANQLSMEEGTTLYYKWARIGSGAGGTQTGDATFRILVANQTTIIANATGTESLNITIKYQDGIPTYAERLEGLIYLPPNCIAQILQGKLNWTTKMETKTLATITDKTMQTQNFSTEAGNFQSINITLNLVGWEYGNLTLIYDINSGILIYEQWTPKYGDLIIHSLSAAAYATKPQNAALSILLTAATFATPATITLFETRRITKKRKLKNKQSPIDTIIKRAFSKKTFYIILVGATLTLASTLLPWSQLAKTPMYLPLSLPTALATQTTLIPITISLTAHSSAILAWISIAISLYTNRKRTAQIAILVSSILAFASTAMLVQSGWTPFLGVPVIAIGGMLTILGAIATNIKIEIVVEETEMPKEKRLQRTGFTRDVHPKKLKENLHLKRTEIIVLVAFFLFSLRVINWFEYPNILLSGDFRIPIVNEAFTKRVLFTWDEVDFGLPSVYMPRILDPLYFLIITFQKFQLSLYTSELLAIILIYFLVSILMYNLMKQITNGDVTASFMATIFLTSNVYLINDRELTAIAFTTSLLTILPSSLALVKGIKARSYKIVAVSAILCNLPYATYPNYRATLICLLTLALFSVFLFIDEGINFQLFKGKQSQKLFTASVNMDTLKDYLKLLSIFALTLLTSSLWIITTIIVNANALIAVYEKLVIPELFVGLKLYDVLRLIVKWSFYQGSMGKPYVPYRDIYSNDPTIVCLSYLPSILAFTSLLTKKKRKATVFFSLIAAVSFALTSGFSFTQYGNVFYHAVSNFPLLNAFREATNWVFFAIISLSILIGYMTSSLCSQLKNKLLKAAIISIIFVIFAYTSYPLITGDVARNWLKPETKGSNFPSSYPELNTMVSDKYWTILLPQTLTYLVYNFSENTLGCGNPYPLIFSKPIISGVGTEYVQSSNVELINMAYDKMKTGVSFRNIALQGEASSSSIEAAEYSPSNAIDGQMWTRWASAKTIPQWFEISWSNTYELTRINIYFEYAYAEDYAIEIWNGSNLTETINVQNNTSLIKEHLFNQPIPTTKIHISFTKASQFNSVSMWELEAYAQTDGVPKLLGMLGIKYLALQKNIVYGNTSSVNELRINESDNFKLIKKWEEIELYENNYALQKIYVADNPLHYRGINDIYTTAENTEWNTLKHSTFINSTSSDEIANKTLTLPENALWNEISPTKYEASIDSTGPFFLVLLESYDEHWKTYINGTLVSERNHLKVNGFANGWLIENAGNLKITIQYQIQDMFTMSVIASVILSALLLAFLCKKEIKQVACRIKGIKFLNECHLRSVTKKELDTN